VFFIDPLYLIIVAPAFLLAMWAQYRVKATYHEALQVDARLSGAAAARYILDSAGLQHVGIEMTQGMLSDHYDPRDKVLRLSPQVYNQNSAASVGIAAHEAGHALQDATNYAPLVIRNAAVPIASFGSSIAIFLLIIGALLAYAGSVFGQGLLLLGIVGFGGTVVFQLVNLPVEFNASTRAKQVLEQYQIVDEHGAVAVRKVLNAAAWTYVAGTLQTILTLLYFVLRYGHLLSGGDE